jgi:DNA polymerase-3 subunit gamma/tau
MTLYLKYRPQNLEELDIKDVRESLKKIFSSGKVPHAFLFAGPKGTGKTSAARIVAKILNCESKNPPCGKCDQCISIMKGNNIDVIELDAASHRGIDDIRALKEVVKLSPARAKKKVYVIDEAHMLTTEASNALLKTLEEPPSHVTFVLATTNPEKLISTIRSRATEITFRKASDEEIGFSLQRVIKGEKIKIGQDTINLITAKSNGSFRDAVKALEQYSLEGSSFLEKFVVTDVENFIDLLFKKDLKSLLSNIKNRVESGGVIDDFVKEILLHLHRKLLGDIQGRGETIKLIELMLDASRQISDSPIEELPLEIAVIKWCEGKRDERKEELIVEEKNEEADTEAEKVTDEIKKVDLPKEVISIGDEIWKSILLTIRPINASIEALLRAAKPMNFDGKTLTLGVFYKFHKERLEEGAHRKVLEEVIAQVLGNQVRVSCILTEPPAKPVVQETVLTDSKDQDIIKAAEEIFGV